MKLAMARGMRVVIMCVFRPVIVVIFMGIVVVMLFFAFKCCAGLNNAAFCCLWQNKQGQRLRKFCNGCVNAGAIFCGLGFILKSDDIGTRRMQFHRNLLTVKGNVQMANTMFMRVQLTDLFGQ